MVVPAEEKHILIIEDEKKIADTLKYGLVENGYQVDAAYDGQIGWNIFKSKSFDLVILDVNLPGINGYEFCRQIRKVNSSIPVIMLTAMHTLSDKVEGYDAGTDDYMAKPFEFRELVLKIRAMLKHAYRDSIPISHVLRAADLEMNLDSREIKRAGVKINLTAKEFQLLEYLLKNKNRVLSRADIAINVWDIDFDTNTNVIDVYISYLRNKIDKNFNQKLIQTHIGAGYILKANDS